MNWIKVGNGNCQKRAQPLQRWKTLTEITENKALISLLKNIIEGRPSGGREIKDSSEGQSSYTIEDADRELFISKEEIERVKELLLLKKNIILQGPPGVS